MKRLFAYFMPAAMSAAGALGALGFAPTSAWPLLLAALALLFFSADRARTSRTAFVLAWCWGLGFFAVGLSWTHRSMAFYGGLGDALAALGVLALAAVCALVPASAMAASRAVRCSSLLRFALVMPALWALSEMIRGVLLGFGWLSVGYAFGSTTLAAWAPVVGVYGVGFAAVLGLGLVLALVRGAKEKSPVGRAALAVALGSLAVASATLSDVRWSAPAGQIAVRLVQPDLPVALRTRLSEVQKRVDRVEAMSTRSVSGAGPEVIIWPEGVWPQPLTRLPAAMALTPRKVADTMDATVLFNAFHESGRREFMNSLWRADARSAVFAPVYSKRHLVPFGEYVPAGFRWFVNALGIPMSDQTPGEASPELLTVANVRFAPGICYENMFPEEVRMWWNKGEPQVLLNMANLGWFAERAADQFTQMSAMRARETARPMLQVVNNSHTAVIAPTGQFERLAGRGAEVVDARVRLFAGAPTPFVRFGHWPLVVLCLMLPAAAFVGGRRRTRLE